MTEIDDTRVWAAKRVKHNNPIYERKKRIHEMKSEKCCVSDKSVYFSWLNTQQHYVAREHNTQSLSLAWRQESALFHILDRTLHEPAREVFSFPEYTIIDIRRKNKRLSVNRRGDNDSTRQRCEWN